MFEGFDFSKMGQMLEECKDRPSRWKKRAKIKNLAQKAAVGW